MGRPLSYAVVVCACAGIAHASERLTATSIAVPTGGSHTLALRPDGSLWSWGANGAGQLGVGDVVNRSTAVSIPSLGPGSRILAYSAGGGASFALMADGRVLAWGGNGTNGTLGINTTETRKETPVEVGCAAIDDPGSPFCSSGGKLRGIVAISAGGAHTLALKSDGTVLAWGLGSNGRLGINSTAAQLRAVHVPCATGEASDTTFCDAAGRLRGIIAISAGGGQSLALQSNREVLSWGQNDNAQLGDGTATQRNVPVSVKGEGGSGRLSGVVQVVAGGTFSLARSASGTVYSWGRNVVGQLGAGTLPATAANQCGAQAAACAKTPVRAGYGNYGDSGFVPLTGVSRISAATSFGMAVKDGTVLAWGFNPNGELGIGDRQNRLNPVEVVQGATHIGASGTHGAARLATGLVVAWGANSVGQLGRASATVELSPVFAKDQAGAGNLSDVAAVVIGNEHALAVKSDGTVLAWGSNASGRLGDGTELQRSLPVPVKGEGGVGTLTGVQSVAPGFNHSFALMPDGTVLGWGFNGFGQLGRGTEAIALTPVKVCGEGAVGTTGDPCGGTYLTLGVPPGGQPDVRAMAASGNFSFALQSDGAVLSFGVNSLGQLGLGDINGRAIPTRITLPSKVKAVSIGGGFGFALEDTDDAAVFAWGANNVGQLGVGVADAMRTSPVMVKSEDGQSVLRGVTAVVAGGGYGLALMQADGRVLGWGANNAGQLGLGNVVNPQLLPVPVICAAGDAPGSAYCSPGGKLRGVVGVWTGSGFSYARLGDGTLVAWGLNDSGQLGLGTTDSPKSTPFRLSLSSVAALATHANAAFTLALGSDGTLRGWGANGAGQLGNGIDLTSFLIPAEVLAEPAPWPMLTLPADKNAEATSPAGAVVTFTVSANDTVDGAVTPVCDHASGATYPLGWTVVNCTATDAGGNRAVGSFDINVTDLTPPQLTCPAPLTLEATGPAGAVASFAAEASDIVSTPALVYSQAPGSSFRLGTTTVTATATDSWRNESSCAFQVRVVDTTPPTITCPANVTAEASFAFGGTVTFPAAVASDVLASAPTIVFSQASGTMFPLGTTTVQATASDAAGNKGSCSFTVTLTAPQAPAQPQQAAPPAETGCGCSPGAAASLLWLWALLGAAHALGRRTRRR